MQRLSYIFLILVLCSFELGAQTPSCPGLGTSIENVIYYVNGVDNKVPEMRASSNLLRSTVGNTSKNQYKIAENRSDGIGKDFYQAYENRVADVDPREFWRDVRRLNPSATSRQIKELYADAVYKASIVEYARSADLREMIGDFLLDLNSGKKVILVAHSQGNFFANAAYRYIRQNWPSYKDSIGIVAIATPAPIVEGGGLLTQNSKDRVIFGAVNLKYSVLPANVTFTGNDTFPVNHGFRTTYMLPGNARSRIVSHVRSTISRLSAPVSPCDDKEAIIQTLTASDIKPSKATLRANLTQGKNARVWFDIDKNPNRVKCSYAGNSGSPKFTAPAGVSVPVNNLIPNTTYTYMACARGSNSKIKDGGIKQLITARNRAKIGIPVSGIVSRNSIQVTSQILEGVNADAWFVHSSSNSSPSCNGQNFDGVGSFSSGDVTVRRIDNLNSNTTYYIRACAKASEGTTHSSPVATIKTNNVPLRDCGTQAFRGGTYGLSVIFDLGGRSGNAQFIFDAFTIPDGLQIYKQGTNQLLFSTGALISGKTTGGFQTYGAEALDVYVTGNPNPNTAWELEIRCPY